MEFIIQRIRSIIGEEQFFSITFYSKEVVFSIYETEIQIVYNMEDKSLVIEGETLAENLRIDARMMEELTTIMNLIDLYIEGVQFDKELS